MITVRVKVKDIVKRPSFLFKLNYRCIHLIDLDQKDMNFPILDQINCHYALSKDIACFPCIQYFIHCLDWTTLLGAYIDLLCICLILFFMTIYILTKTILMNKSYLFYTYDQSILIVFIVI